MSKYCFVGEPALENPEVPKKCIRIENWNGVVSDLLASCQRNENLIQIAAFVPCVIQQKIIMNRKRKAAVKIENPWCFL